MEWWNVWETKKQMKNVEKGGYWKLRGIRRYFRRMQITLKKELVQCHFEKSERGELLIGRWMVESSGGNMLGTF